MKASSDREVTGGSTVYVSIASSKKSKFWRMLRSFFQPKILNVREGLRIPSTLTSRRRVQPVTHLLFHTLSRPSRATIINIEPHTMRRSISSADGYSSSSSTSPTTRQRAFFEQQQKRRSSRTRSHPPPRDGEPTLAGSVGKLVRLAVLALILALVVPYVKTYLWGGGGSKALVEKNVTGGLGLTETAYPTQEQDEDQEPDVFSFKHEDYLSAARSDMKHKLKNAASKASAAVVAKPSARQQQQKRKQTARTTRSRTQRKSLPRNDDDDDDHDDYDDDHSSSSTTIVSTITSIFTLLSTTTTFIFRFASIPFIHLFHLLSHLLTTSYHYTHLSLTSILLPIQHILAPLTYLFLGLFFLFVQIPFSLISAVVKELYPVYIFLGAASVFGITMGVMAAGVLYLTAYVFVDRVDQPSSEKGRGKQRSMFQQEFSATHPNHGYRYTRQDDSYFTTPHDEHASPLVSPTSKRAGRRGFGGDSFSTGSFRTADVV
ncbi:hypothetical protein PHSY_003523 [Pseudozyma hubeiensis SY62]|uniref:Uncharacterized protein n=1 Tax=Pseudozyma hubeiensis (strain SY62) TaxID=1305764 RepID=R9PCZ5_PSEHS|nr:hypothetical protein PHSY_003523 [Pseudozyma hubeiensis SY62]GAC95945.1 hypothetical protein PHSY_003523 [Pseudozyma hubeiensis SY62]